MTELYGRILRAAAATPWAMDEAKFAEVEAFLALKAAGLDVSADRRTDVRAAGPAQPRSANRVAVIPVYGTIAPKANMLTDFSGGTTCRALVASIREAVDDPTVKTIVLDVDSPGGNVVGVQEAASEILAARAEKRIIAVAQFQMASAAYWLSACATEIVAAPSASVGSIGVFALHLDESGALAKAGVKPTLISAGQYKAETLSAFPLSDGAQAYTQSQVDEVYSTFIAAIAKGRGVSAATVRAKFGGGRSMSATAGKAAGMVDRIATLGAVLASLGVTGAAGPSRSLSAPSQALSASARRLRLLELG